MTDHIPHGRTARRLAWPHLPPQLRGEVERRLGSHVVEADSCDAGFTPGFASVLACADGSRHFVKAASTKAQRAFAHSYREEARKAAALPAGVPAPALRWSLDGDWVVLCFEYVDARPPQRPWQTEELTATLAAVTRCAELLTPAPEGLAPHTFAEEMAAMPALWETLTRLRPDLAHLSDAASLAADFAAYTSGDTVVHTDVRDDNVLITPTGQALLCDWNWPVRGAAWIDPVMTLIGPRGDGVDITGIWEDTPLLRTAPAEGVDRLLALLVGYFWKSGADPVPPTSPYLRAAQQWQGDVCWAWLSERRGWPAR